MRAGRGNDGRWVQAEGECAGREQQPANRGDAACVRSEQPERHHSAHHHWECAVRSIINKASNADTPIVFSDYDHVMDKGPDAFNTWWKASGAKLQAAAPPASAP